jgi:hypothetical protein
VNRISIRAAAAIGLAAAACAAGLAAASAASAASPTAVGAKKHRKHKKKHRKTTPGGPSFSVLGFGVNRLFVAAGKTVSSTAQCSEMVDAPPGGVIGPPQTEYLTVYVHAADIPASAPTSYQDSLAQGASMFSEPTPTPPEPLTSVFAKGGFLFGSPSGSQTDLYHQLITSAGGEFGAYEGPSPEEFDGTYSMTATVETGGHKLTSTATVNVNCPMLR